MNQPAPQYPGAPSAGGAVGVFSATDVQLLQQAFDIANRAATQHVAERCHPVRGADGTRWLDTRPMLDPRERSGAGIDLSTSYLHYLLDAGLAKRHPHDRHLVRLVWCMAERA